MRQATAWRRMTSAHSPISARSPTPTRTSRRAPRIVANAFMALGHYYLKGIPNTAIVPDASRAREMFSYAASYFGDADAQYQLGRLYALGRDCAGTEDA